MENTELGEVVPPKLHHAGSGRQFRFVAASGRAVVAEGGGQSWFVYTEDEPENMTGGSLDGAVIAGLLGHGWNVEYPAEFDEWANNVLAATKR